LETSVFEYRVESNQVHLHDVDWDDDYAQVVSGGILGDGYLALRKKMVTPMYIETHGYRQRDYVIWKRSILGASMGDYTTFDERTGKFYVSSTLWVTDPRNVGLYDSFYLNGKKVVTPKALGHVQDLGLTVLWLDDGSIKLHDGNGKLSLQSFTPEENRSVMSWLSERYGINSYLSPENEIFFNSKEMPKLLSVVYPVYKEYRLPDCMRYKMGYMDPGNQRLIENAKEKRRVRDRENYRRIMRDPVRKARLRETSNRAQKRRLADSTYRQSYDEYHKEWMTRKRQRERHGE
jgi:hypothetical protein